MRHAIWKLAALASVVGVGLLVVVQAQRSMNKSGSGKSAESQESAAEEINSTSEPESEPSTATQSEPGLGPEGFSDSEPVSAELKTGSRMTAARSSRPAAKSVMSDPFDLDEPSADEPSKRSTSRAADRAPASNVANLDDSDDPFNTPAPRTRSPGEKPATDRVVLTLNGDEPDAGAGPKLIADEPLETDSPAGPRLLAANDETPRKKPASNTSTDPFGDDETPAARPGPKTTPARVPPKPSAEDDPFGEGTTTKPARPSSLKGSLNTVRDAEIGLSDDPPLTDRSKPGAPTNAKARPTAPATPLESDDDLLIAPKPKSAARATAPSSLADDDLPTEPAAKQPMRTATPSTTRPNSIASDPFGDEEPAKQPAPTTKPDARKSNAAALDPFADDEPAQLPAARAKPAPTVADDEPVSKPADESDAFPKTRREVQEPGDSALTDEAPPKRAKGNISIPTLTDGDDGQSAPTKQPTRGNSMGIARPAPSSSDPFGDEDKVESKPAPNPVRPAPSLADEEPAPKAADDADAFPKEIGRPAPAPDQETPAADPVPNNNPKPLGRPGHDESESIGRSAPVVTPGKTPSQRVHSPQVAIDKVAPETAHLHQEMIYHIHVRNVGSSPAHQVTVEDTIPKGVKLIGSIPRAMSDGNRLIWKLGTLEPGQDRKISVKVIPQSEGVIGTVATVNFAAEVGSRTTIASPKLKLELDAPRQVSIGAPVILNFRISNVGRADASGVVLREVLPAHLRHPEGDDLEYEIGALPAGRTREVKLTLTAAQAGRAVNRAVVTADGNLSEESELQFEVVGPTLGVTRTGPKKLFLNKVGTFSNTVTNPGSTAATNLMLVETVPAGFEFVSATEDGQYNSAKRQVSWNISRLEPGESRKVQVTLSANGRGSQVSVVRAYDGGGASGEAVTTTNVTGIASLSIDVSEIPSLVEVGEGITLQVRVRNRGTDVATNVRATIAVPSGMEVVSVSGQGNPKAANVAAPAGAGGSRSFRNQREIQLDPIARLDSREEATIDVTLQARAAGKGRLNLAVQSDQTGEPIRREELLEVVTAQE